MLRKRYSIEDRAHHIQRNAETSKKKKQTKYVWMRNQAHAQLYRFCPGVVVYTVPYSTVRLLIEPSPVRKSQWTSRAHDNLFKQTLSCYYFWEKKEKNKTNNMPFSSGNCEMKGISPARIPHHHHPHNRIGEELVVDFIPARFLVKFMAIELTPCLLAIQNATA